MKLAVLIPTLPEERNQSFIKRLMGIIQPQVDRHSNEVEIKIHDAPRSMPTGTKRNELIHNSDSEYFCFIDDDDSVPSYYLDELLKAINQNPDVITFTGVMTTDGNNPRPFTIKLGEKYEERGGRYYRYPNHLCCFKRSIVERVKFPDVYVQEDYHWATKIRDLGLLKTEVHIPMDMYTYEFQTNKQAYDHTKPRLQSRVIRRTRLR